jgi:hypothetical protein
MIAAAGPIAALATAVGARATIDLAASFAMACSDLALGFAAPLGSRERARAHARAWIAVRDLDRAVTAVARRRLAAADMIARARRAVDRADVMVGALPGVLPN